MGYAHGCGNCVWGNDVGMTRWGGNITPPPLTHNVQKLIMYNCARGCVWVLPLKVCCVVFRNPVPGMSYKQRKPIKFARNGSVKRAKAFTSYGRAAREGMAQKRRTAYQTRFTGTPGEIKFFDTLINSPIDTTAENITSLNLLS